MERPARAERLDLERHPEGGWFRRTWTSPLTVDLPRGPRAAASLIHYLLEDGDASAWHVVRSDEIWLWHGPGRLTLQFGGEGEAPELGATVVLGGDIPAGERAQVVIPAGSWQRTLPSDGETLVSCVVSPEFRFDDWKLDTGQR
ncbi:cupin domain-containing protein [Humibacter sp. RRB41]|uniref:cupin domain-containing protein n=1 Tax=Humibacter sp. RRB41 TaxID=2919946 RepID=UPI001FAA98AA|nr:cupin domain-containing protein [Humibacter sp. RRB41]